MFGHEKADIGRAHTAQRIPGMGKLGSICRRHNSTRRIAEDAVAKLSALQIEFLFFFIFFIVFSLIITRRASEHLNISIII